MTAIFMGLIFILLGFWGILYWLGDLILIVRGLGPVSLLVGGLVSVIAGVASIQSRRKNQKADK
jgi:hypothetical protein